MELQQQEYKQLIEGIGILLTAGKEKVEYGSQLFDRFSAYLTQD